MQGFKLMFFGLMMGLILNCSARSNDIFDLKNSECRLWWIYDEAISDGPTPFFICFTKRKYYTYSITRDGNLRKPLMSDVVYPLTGYGDWVIKNDSLYLQGSVFSSVKKVSDTVFLRPDAFLLDATNKFNIENCNCGSLIVQFKGGAIDSMKTLLHYKE